MNILEQPQPFFDMFKGMFTHGVMCLTKDGSPVWVVKVINSKAPVSHSTRDSIYQQERTA